MLEVLKAWKPSLRDATSKIRLGYPLSYCAETSGNLLKPAVKGDVSFFGTEECFEGQLSLEHHV